MTMTWELDSTKHDLMIVGGKLKIISGADEVRQRILIALWHYWEEYFLNVPAGVPWYELILGSKNKKTVEALLRKAVLDVPGVISIMQFQMQLAVGSLRDFVIFMNVEVIGGFVAIIATPPASVPAWTSSYYLVNQDGLKLMNDSNVYLTI
jgi:hypothetical protein